MVQILKNGEGKNHSRSGATARIFATSIFQNPAIFQNPSIFQKMRQGFQKMRQGFPHIATGIFVTRSKEYCREFSSAAVLCLRPRSGEFVKIFNHLRLIATKSRERSGLVHIRCEKPVSLWSDG